MATLLYRLGRFSYRRRRFVAAGWGLLLVLLATGTLLLGGKTVDTFSIPGTESQQALDDLRRELPSSAGATLTVVVRAPAGTTLNTAPMKAAVAAVVARARALPSVAGVFDPYQSRQIS